MHRTTTRRVRRAPRSLASDWLGSPGTARLEARSLAAPTPGLILVSTNDTLELSGTLFQPVTATAGTNPMLWTGDYTSDPYSTTADPTKIRANAPFSAKAEGTGTWKLTNPDGTNAGSGTDTGWDWSDWKVGTHMTPGATAPDVLFVAAHQAVDVTANPGTGPMSGDTLMDSVSALTNGTETYGGYWMIFNVEDTSTNPPSAWNSQNTQSGGLEIKGGFFIDHRTLTPPAGTPFFSDAGNSYTEGGYRLNYELDLLISTGSGPKLDPILTITQNATNQQDSTFYVTRANGTGVINDTYANFGYIGTPGVDKQIGTPNVTNAEVNPVTNAGTFDFVIHPSGQTQSTYWSNPELVVQYSAGDYDTWTGAMAGEHTEMAMFETHVTSISPHS